MSDAGVSITLKTGPEYQTPWIVVKGETPQQALDMLAELRQLGGLQAAKSASDEFQAKPPASSQEAGGTIQQVMPGSSAPVPECPACKSPMKFGKQGKIKGILNNKYVCPNNPSHKAVYEEAR